MSGWYYMHEGWLGDDEKGPITDATMLQMAFDGELKPKSKVRHEKHTRNQWAYLEQVPAAKKKCIEGEQERATLAEARRIEKESEKRAQAVAKAKRDAETAAAREVERQQRQSQMEAEAKAREKAEHHAREQRAAAAAALQSTPRQPHAAPAQYVVVQPHSQHQQQPAIESDVYSCRPAMFRNRPVLFLIWVVLIPVGIGILALVVWWLLKLGTLLTVTTKRTILRHGLLSKHTSEVRHADVRNLVASQSFIQRIFGVGTLGVSSAAQGGFEIWVAGIPNPQYVKELINGYRQ